MRQAFVILLIAGLSVPALKAQARFPWWEGPIAKSLDLTDAQNAQIRATVAEYRDKLRDLRAAVNKAETDLEAIFNEESVDQRQANDAINQLAAARSELFKTTSQMDLKLRIALTAQQWQVLQAQQRPGRGPGSPRRRGAGGPGSKNPIAGSAATK
ncbi:MAG: periplasmic heavy metal sensor [Bryobacterales bacterium]|nr:periplasmic heavy metal sensor [Bryobacterales bacterium]MBV9399587.1 periplasmic heavy metal sensor [Bryobacterales bacterium]